MFFPVRYVLSSLLCTVFLFRAYSQDITLSKGRSITHIANESSYPYGVSVSDSGWVLVASSKRISIHSPNLTEISGQSPEDIFQRSYVFSVQSGYSSDKNLFLLIALVSNESRPTELAIAYFKADTSATGWNSYYYNSDIENNGYNLLQNLSVGVYPQEAIITGEMVDTSGHVKNVVLQMSLRGIEQAKPGLFNWKNLPTFSSGSPGILCPVKSLAGPPYFIVSNQKTVFAQLFCYAISDTLNGTAEISGYSFSVPTYYPPAPFQPVGFSEVLPSGDSRIRDAYLQDSTLFLTYTTQKNSFSTTVLAQVKLRNSQVEILNAPDSSEWGCFPGIAPAFQNGSWLGSILLQKRYSISSFGFYEAYGVGKIPQSPTSMYLKLSTENPQPINWGGITQVASNPAGNSWAIASFNKNGKLQTTATELISQTVSRLGENTPPEISLFPNPAQQNLSVVIPGGSQLAVSVRIYNMLGEIVFYQALDYEPTLNVAVSNWPKEIYIVEIQFVNGNRTYKKLVTR